MIVTAHQPNTFFAASIITKIQASGALILLDEVQYTKNGWTNRNKAPDGSWLTIPVESHCAFKPINRVKIGEPAKEWRPSFCARLRAAWPGEVTEAICIEVMRPRELLLGLNMAILKIILEELAPAVSWQMQSWLAGGHSLPAVSPDREQLKPISWQIAHMVSELGGTVYLSGPSGRNYLSEEPFTEHGIAVEYWSHEGENPCALSLIKQYGGV